MVSGEEHFTNILSRIKNLAPCSVVIESDNVDDAGFVDNFLCVEEESLSEALILPVRVDCAQHNDSLSIWKSIADAIELGMKRVYPGDDMTKDYFDRISSTDDTDDVQSYLLMILSVILENCGWHFLLILEHFECAIDEMPDYDIMKLRQMTESVVLMTITHATLEDLCKQEYEYAYFANQFADPNFI